MALSSVLPGSYFGDAVSQNGYGFEYLGKLYLFTYRQVDDAFADDRHFRCMRSVDAGATWAEVGTGPQWPIDTPSGLNSGFPIAYTVGLDGSNAILLWVNGTKSPLTALNWINLTISKVVFNLTSNSWGSVTTAAASFMGLMDTQDQSSTTTHSNRTSIQLIVRGPSNYLVYVPGAQSGTGTSLRAKATVVPYDGGFFGSPIPIPGQASNKWYMPCGSVYDPASGNTHFLMAGGNLSGGQPSLFHAAMDSGNSYGSLSTVIDSTITPGDMNAGANTGPDGVSQPIIYTDGGTRKVAFVSSVFSTSPFPVFVRFFSAMEALNPTFTHSEISTDQAIAPLDIPHFAAHAEVFSLAANSVTLIATWISFNGATNQPSDIYYSTSPATGIPTWSAPISVIPTPAALPISGGGTSPYVNVQGLAFPMTGGFGVFGTAEQTGNFTPFFVSKYSFVAAAEPPSPPGVTCGSPPDGKVGTAYSHTFPAIGGTPPYVFTITTGTLPPGLLLTSGSGNVSGTPTLAGDYPIAVTVTDANALSGTADCSLHIGIGIDCNNPPVGTLGDPYSHALTILGAPAGSTVFISAGALPAGLAIDNAGLISGTPTLAGAYSFTATVNTPSSGSASVSCSIVIGGAGSSGSIDITCGNPPGGKVGVVYSHTFPVVGATGPTRYSVVVGALPPGVHLDPATGDLSGTPTAPGTYSFSIKVQQ